MSSAIKIPKGKTMRILQGGSSVVGSIPLLLDEEITLSLSSRFEPLIASDSKFNKALSVLGSLSRDILSLGFSGQFEQMGFHVWQGSDPIIFNTTIGFYINKNNVDAYNQVYIPVMKLCTLPLPTRGSAGNLIPPGPSVLSLITGEQVEGVGNHIYSIEIGNIIFISNIVVRRAEPTFSLDTDERDYPIWGKVQLEFQTAVNASVQLLLSNAPASLFNELGSINTRDIGRRNI
jgi:hypothetical protein